MKQTQKKLMRSSLLSSIILLLLVLPCSIRAQPNAVIYQNWKMLGESVSMIDVSARILKCAPESITQMHVEIFNESSNDQTAHFKITLSNPITHAQKIYEISLAVLKAAIVKPDCGSNNYPSLRLNIPPGWDPATVEYTITFIP